MDFAQRAIGIARTSVAEGELPSERSSSRTVKSSPRASRSPNPRPDRPRGDSRDPRGLPEAGHGVPDRMTVYAIAHPCPMCLAALYHCAPDEVVFMATREATSPYLAGGHQKYYEPDTFYGEFGKPYQRRLPMRLESRDDAVEVYKIFRERHNGDQPITAADCVHRSQFGRPIRSRLENQTRRHCDDADAGTDPQRLLVPRCAALHHDRSSPGESE